MFNEDTHIKKSSHTHEMNMNSQCPFSSLWMREASAAPKYTCRTFYVYSDACGWKRLHVESDQIEERETQHLIIISGRMDALKYVTNTHTCCQMTKY